MTSDDWTLLAERSRALVHSASLLMGVLTHPTQSRDHRAQAASGADALLCVLSAAPELAAHHRTLHRFEAALAAWRRSIVDASPLAQRYQIALLQRAAQAVTTCLHVETLAASESARERVPRYDVNGRPSPPSR
jgi:hypothetical protein